MMLIHHKQVDRSNDLIIDYIMLNPVILKLC